MRLALLLVLAASAGCDTTTPPPADDVVPRGGRTLAIDVTEAEGEDFGDALAAARDLGASALSLSQGWDVLETSPGRFEPETDFLDIGNTIYSALDWDVALALTTIDTNVDRRPPDLRGLPWDAPEVATRYRALLDWAASQTPDMTVTHVMLGNEVDIFLGGDTEAWAAYRALIAAVADHARTLWPNATVGTTVTVEGATGPHADEVATLQRLGDAALVTYYPLDAGFQIRPASTVAGDFEDVLDRLDGEVHFLEAGYPTGSATGGSEAAQAAFVRALFAAWDDHADRVPYVAFSFLTDFPEATVDELEAYYGISDRAFLDYLGTLGLRTASGREKEAFDVFDAEAEARGW